MESSNTTMTQCEDQSGRGEFIPSERISCLQTPTSLHDDGSQLSNHILSFNTSLSQNETSCLSDGQSMPPSESALPPPPSKLIKEPDDYLPETIPQGVAGHPVLELRFPSKGNFSSVRTPYALDGMIESSQSSDVMSPLHPPQSGSSKSLVKRGPGRPRKDSITCRNSRLPTGHKMKNLFGSVRGRKKVDAGNAVGGSNLVSMNTGDVSIGYSPPPRGTDDTAESDTSSVASSMEKLHEEVSLFPEVWPGKVCVFCNLGERSMLGQGELLRLEISEGFDPVAAAKGLTVIRKGESVCASDKCQKPGGLFARRQKGSGKMKRLVSQGSLESMNEPVDEVCGYQEEPEYSVVFDCVLGAYFVHSNCALWCYGVEKDESSCFQNLEVEIARAINQRCQHCGNLGAGLICKMEGCCNLLHYPCAALSGAFQDPATRSVVCFSHIESSQLIVGSSANCTVCDSKGDIASLVMCSSCGRHYHGICMALNSDLGIRAGWQCPACKVCQACRQPGEESKLLACDTCDKSYHIFCLRPALSSIPKHSWKCKMCRMCTDCGARTPGSGPSSRWHANFSVCDSCYQQRNKGLACPLCGKAYRHVAQKLMLQCHLCKKYVHGTCDPAADRTTYQQRKDLYPDYEYICIPCKAAGTGLNTLGGNPRVLSAIKRSDKEDQDEGISPSNFAVSQDSLLSIEDDSLPGTESSNDLIWLDKCLTASLEDIKPLLPVPQLCIKDKILTPDKFQKKKMITGRIKGAEKVSHLSVNNNNGRKNRLNEFAKKRGPKPKLRLFGNARVGMNRSSTESYKRDEELGVENRMVLCSARDEFVIHQDVCVMCGAFGNDFEGRLISCAQCGQCYHPFCVNVKVTKVVLLKGWRCLDCTVCEGCGQRNDESRLILCDECDVSFHIYCIDPPLERVPQGSWKCKWCAICQYCGSNDPGYNSSWHANYTKCGPCASNNMCPVCNSGYSDGDLIIKCFQCERWLHSLCDMIKDTDDAEKCAEDGYFCILCRPTDALPPHLRPPPPIIVPKIESPPCSPDLPVKSVTQFLIDGICLSESGMGHIKSLTLELPRKKRKKIPSAADREAGILAAIEAVVSREDDKVQILNRNNSDEMNEKDKDAKKRQKNLQKLGIGGFLARLRGPRFKDEENDAMSEQNSMTADGDKPKRKAPRRKNKNKLIETFPSYLQEAFFGKGLLDPTKESDLPTVEDPDVDTVASLRTENTIKLSTEEIQELDAIMLRQQQTELSQANKSGSQSVKNRQEDIKDNTRPIKATSADGNASTGVVIHDMIPLSGDLLDHDLVDTIMNERDVDKDEDIRRGSSQLQGDQNPDENGHKDELTDFLSSQFNLESMDSGLPTMDSKDVEDIFKGVEESQDNLFSINTVPVAKPQLNSTTSASVLSSGMPVTSSPSIMPLTLTQSVQAQGSPSITRTASIQQNLASPVSFPPPSPYHSEYSNSPQFSPAFSEPPSPWPAPSEDADQPSSYNQRSILKWEADESLGANATISAVLYANINHPELKRDFQSWGERSKQIAKIWRGLPSEKRAPYLQKARENRAASRMQKAQQMPKDIRAGVSCKKEISQIPSPEGVQTSLSSPQVPTATFADSNSTSSNNECSASGTSPYATPCYSVASASNQSHSVVSYSSSSGTSGQLPGSFHQNMYMNTSSTTVSKSVSFTNQGKEDCNSKYSFGDRDRDHLIKVLTPSEIMKSLPDLKQDDCGFTSRMDQDKPIPSIASGQPKTPRLETQEERHWKQMQALRQHHSQQQDQITKDAVNSGHAGMSPGGSHSQFPFPTGTATPGGVLMPRSAVSDNLSHNPTLTPDSVRQPLQVSTPHDQKPLLLHSPRVQSPISRPPVPVSMQPIRPGGATEMPPPIPSLHFGRPPLPSSQALRSPLYPRGPFTHSPRLPTPTHNSDGYGNLQSSEQQVHPLPQLRAFNDSEGIPTSESGHYTIQNNVHESGDIGSANRSTASPQGQETRQHLRDLLQRQHVKKLEQDQMPPSATEGGQGAQRAPWAHEEWPKSGAVDGNPMVRHPVGAMQPQGLQQLNQFRQPFLPSHLRMPPANSQIPSGLQPIGRSGEFRMGMTSQSAAIQAADPRARIMLNQQRVMMNMQQQSITRQQTFIGSQTTQFQQVRNPMDPYGHLVVQQQPRMQGGGIVTSSSSMLAQQLGRPLNSMVSGQRGAETVAPQITQQQTISSAPQPQAMNNTPIITEPNTMSSPMQSDHQELPDSVTAELEKLEQEQHNENNTESELVDFGMDDDDLLGMGADFNILEYADPELDQVVGGEKTNILDNLDLEEEEKDENKEQKRKEDSESLDFRQSGSRGSKKEGIEYSSSGKPIKPIVSPKPPEQGSVQPNSVMMSPSKPSFGHGTGSMDGNVQPLLRPTQPPPPYPGPPPPYPGRPQMGIRNGCGVGVNVPPVVAVGLGPKSSVAGFVGGGRPPALQVSTLAMHSNPHLSLHQRRTLLLQEQPLLLEDLLEQEKREQLRQGSGLIGAAPEEPLLSDLDFERLKADVLFSSSNLPNSLSPPNVVGQNVMSMPPQPSGLLNRNQSITTGEWQMGNEGNVRRPDVSVDSNPNVHTLSLIQSGTSAGNSSISGESRLPSFPLQSIPPPPNPPEHPTTEQERQMQIAYEQWLYSQQNVLGAQLKYYETEVHKRRKSKKSLNSKLRQLRKNGNDLTENDALELEKIGKELPVLQKQLDQARKQLRQHNLLIQDYRNKQQKMQQMMGMSPSQGSGPPGSVPTLPSPLGPASSSPLHSTPQSPMLSPSPSMGGPSPSPHMQNSPMASPLTPSPGPASNSLCQTSPRGNMNPNVHNLDEMPFSPMSDNRQLISQNPNVAGRIQAQHHQVSHLRMGSPNVSSHQIMVSQGNMNISNNSSNFSFVQHRGMNVNMVQMNQQRPQLDNQSGFQRMRSLVPQDQMRNMNQMGQRFQRIGMNQELMMRARPPSNFTGQPQMAMSPGGQIYNPVRVSFPSQSPTGSNAGSLRSPSPMTQMGGMGSPPSNQMLMSQNRVSPASSPMRRPSGSGSVGSASPMAERPQSVENPLTPRNSGSRPHTPSSSGGHSTQNLDGITIPLQQHMDNQHFNSSDGCGLSNVGSPTTRNMQNFMPNAPDFNPNVSHANTDYNSSTGGGGGGGGNPQILPFPNFSWFDQPFKLGLRGGNPFSVVSEHNPSTSNPIAQENPTAPMGPGPPVSVSEVNTSQQSVPLNSVAVNSIESTENFNHVNSNHTTSLPTNSSSSTSAHGSLNPTEESSLATDSLLIVKKSVTSSSELANTSKISPNSTKTVTNLVEESEVSKLPTTDTCSTSALSEIIVKTATTETMGLLTDVSKSTQPQSENCVASESNATTDSHDLHQNSENYRAKSPVLESKSSDIPASIFEPQTSSITPNAVNSSKNNELTKVVALSTISGVVEKVVAAQTNLTYITPAVSETINSATLAPGDSSQLPPLENAKETSSLPNCAKPVSTIEQPSKVTKLLLTSKLTPGNVGVVKSSSELYPVSSAPIQDNLTNALKVGSNANLCTAITSDPEPSHLACPTTGISSHPTLTVYISSAIKSSPQADTVLQTKLHIPPPSNQKQNTHEIPAKKPMISSLPEATLVPKIEKGDHEVKLEEHQNLKSNLNFVMSELVTCAQLTTSTAPLMETTQSKTTPLHISAQSSGSMIVSTSGVAQSTGQGSITSPGESQNALLKQLLQNTGCASMAQASENVGFSLTSCLQSRPVNTTVVHTSQTSHLSEAATRIPQPTPSVRPPGPPTPIPSPTSRPIKMESNEDLSLLEQPHVQLVVPIKIQTPILPPEEMHQVASEEPQPTSLQPVVSEASMDSQPASIIVNIESKVIQENEQAEKFMPEMTTIKILESKKPDEEAKKAKRRQYQSKRKQQSIGKEPATAAPKKRPRKAGKPEEDFDAFIDTFMVQLRQLPPVGIVEPDLGHSYNTRPIFGVGDYSKLNTKGYSTRLGDMTGVFGQGTLNANSDYYSTKPYGRENPKPPQKTSPTHRGFYNQEFAAPRTSTLVEQRVPVENRTPTPIRDSDTPDTIVSSSSPECSNRESPDLFPGLKLVETDEDKARHLRDSPTIPIVVPIPIRPLLAAKLARAALDADKENSSSKDGIFAKARASGPFKENGNITVTLTLSATAVDDIRGVLRNLANILSIAPPTYQLSERSHSPPDQKFFTYKTKDGKEAVDIQSILNGTAKFCKHCDVLVLNNIIKKKASDIPGFTSETSESSSSEYYFCSSNCYMQFSMTHGVDVAAWDKAPTVVKHINDSRVEIKSEKQTQAKDCRNGPVRNVLQSRKEGLGVKVDQENKSSSLKRPAVRSENEPPVKKWKGSRYKIWTASISQTVKYKKPTEKELTEMLFRLGITAMPSKLPEDTRRCTFCHQIGDGVSDGPGRLLNFDVDKWVHLNCALWSEEVYETENGALVNVEVALKQSLALACIICKQSGASVKCFKVRCTSVYHCGCAVKDGCSFYKNKSVYCPAHIPKGEKENELTSLSVFRRVYVQRDENRQVAVVMHHVDQHHLLRVGSLIFLNVGQLLPHHLHNFHTGNYIYPVGYKIVRFYWSMTKVNKRCQYICSIHDVDGRPEFRITAQDEGCKEQILKAGTAQGAWLQVLHAISKLRNAHDSIKIFPKYITGEDLFGLTEPAIVKVLESLPGIETLTDYHFKYGRNPLLELPLAINPSGSARSEPKLRTHFKRPHTQRTGASRTSLPSSVLSSSEAACPYSKQFVHSKSSQYKKMKQEWRNNVYLARSKIQGLGLYAARDIEKHTMVIEYIGEIIRNELAESREKKYELQNRGIYMFRMDDERVIDATLCGGLARYINHSCNPNCVAETVEVDRDVRIIIFANRRISRGEELAYDYKFEFEDDQHKIPCNCGAHNCQQWMN